MRIQSGMSELDPAYLLAACNLRHCSRQGMQLQTNKKSLHQQNHHPHCLAHGEAVTQQVHIFFASFPILSPSALPLANVGCPRCDFRRQEN